MASGYTAKETSCLNLIYLTLSLIETGH